ncbi:hypothetical protein MASR2M18_00160 [Ignavibacteria bacterium]|jgi:thiol-disulfide isomerase/thioredoxin|nr:TlpA family protein disulfide reductase [Bacteroidota bacterium]MCZ2131784.1 TlpA family protein disulfide reductase [Bacteroidota bacterium]
MKKTFLSFVLSAAALIVFGGFGGTQILPSANVKDLQGKTVNTSAISNDGKPILVSFWATWCKPCLQELKAIHNVYDTWKQETGVKVVAISIDDARNASKVKPFVNGLGWEFDVYLDENGDFKRAMNVNNVPHSFLIDGNTGKVVWQHNSYAPGDENHLYEEIKKLASGTGIAAPASEH